MHLILGIDISPLLKAQKKFETFRINIIDEQDKAGAIQAFEFCFELSWKTMKRILQKKGIDVRSPRDSFRDAAANNIISDPKIWFDFIEKRNLTAHTYEEKTVDEVVNIFDQFSKELNTLIHNIQSIEQK